MAGIFTVDGIVYNASVPAGGLTRKAEILDGSNAGRSTSGYMARDIIGTYYNYTLQINTSCLDKRVYDRLYQVLSAPEDSHTVTLPYGQETLTFEAYVSSVEDTLKLMGPNENWWGDLSVTFTAMEPARTGAGG